MTPSDDWAWSDELGRWGMRGFNGVDQRYVETPLSIENTAFSWSGWAWGFSAANGAAFGNGDSTQPYRKLLIDLAGSAGGEARCYCGNGSSYSFASYVYSHDASTPNHYYMDRYGLSAPRLFINGEQVTWDAVNSVALYSSTSTDCRLSPVPFRIYDGLWADQMVWDRALSVAEIQRLADPSNVMLDGLIKEQYSRMVFADDSEPAPSPGDYYFIGLDGDLWTNTTTAWSESDGGPPVANYPVSINRAFFTSNSTGECIVEGDQEASGLIMQSEGNLTINGSLTAYNIALTGTNHISGPGLLDVVTNADTTTSIVGDLFDSLSVLRYTYGTSHAVPAVDYLGVSTVTFFDETGVTASLAAGTGSFNALTLTKTSGVDATFDFSLADIILNGNWTANCSGGTDTLVEPSVLNIQGSGNQSVDMRNITDKEIATMVLTKTSGDVDMYDVSGGLSGSSSNALSLYNDSWIDSQPTLSLNSLNVTSDSSLTGSFTVDDIVCSGELYCDSGECNNLSLGSGGNIGGSGSLHMRSGSGEGLIEFHEDGTFSPDLTFYIHSFNSDKVLSEGTFGCPVNFLTEVGDTTDAVVDFPNDSHYSFTESLTLQISGVEQSIFFTPRTNNIFSVGSLILDNDSTTGMIYVGEESGNGFVFDIAGDLSGTSGVEFYNQKIDFVGDTNSIATAAFDLGDVVIRKNTTGLYVQLSQDQVFASLHNACGVLDFSGQDIVVTNDLTSAPSGYFANFDNTDWDISGSMHLYGNSNGRLDLCSAAGYAVSVSGDAIIEFAKADGMNATGGSTVNIYGFKDC